MDNQHTTMAIPPLQIGAGQAASSSATSTNGRINRVFVQSTKVHTVNLKLEWRIENFEMLMRLSPNGKYSVSKKFFAPEAPGIVWEMHCYPNGKRDEDVNNASFFLRQSGLSHRDEGIRTDFYIYFIRENKDYVSVCRDIKDFTSQQGRGKYQVSPATINQAVHSDGSILVAVETEFIPPGCKMMAEEIKPNASLLDDEDLETLNLSDALADMFENELHADCSFKVGGKTIMAHRCILSQHSTVFRAMFSTDLTQESRDGVINIVDFEAEHVKAMLEFIYTGVVNQRVLAKSPESIFAIADKYAIMPLRSHMQHYLASIVNKNNLVSISLIADTHFAPNLKKVCVRFMTLNHRSVISTPQWQELREKRPDLANELLEMVLDGRSPSAMDVDGSPRADEPTVEERQLTLYDYLPHRRALREGGGEVAAPNPPNTEPPQPVLAVRRVQPLRRVRQVQVEVQEETPMQSPVPRRVRRGRAG